MYTYRATIVRVIDGDTLVVDIDLGFSIFRKTETIRLGGLDTAERALGTAAKERVKELCLPGTSILITTRKDRKEKYGRYLAVVILADGRELNKLLLDESLATPYTGGKRE